MPDTPRRDRPWSRPERPSAPAWPAKLSGFFIAGIGLLFLGAALWAVGDYLRWGVSLVDGGDTVDAPRQQDSPSAPSRGASLTESSNTNAEPRMDPIFLPVPGENRFEQKPTVSSGVATRPRTETMAAQARALAKSRQMTAVADGVEALAVVQGWVEEARLWHENVEPLLTNETGRCIAARTELLDQFRAVMAEDRPGPERAGAAEAAMQSLLEPLRNASNDNQDLSPVEARVLSEFQRLRDEARLHAGKLRQLRVRIEAIATQAGGIDAGNIPLAEAIEQRERELAAIDARDLEARLAKARLEAAEAKAAAEEEAIVAEGARTADAIRAQAEHKKLVARAKQPDVQRYLAPFLAPGYFQPQGQHLTVSYTRTTQKQPVSFSLLEGTGALDDSIKGLQTLNLLASRGWVPDNPWHDRPYWNFSVDRPWSTADQEYVAHAQKLLRELGPTLVELQLLAR